MKPKYPLYRNLSLATVTLALSALSTPALMAQSWVGNGNQVFPGAIWGGNANWSGGVANGVNNTATFGNSFNNGYSCIVNTNRVIGNITFNDPANANDLILRTHGNNFTLTLDVTSGMSAVAVNQLGRTMIIEPRVAGNDGFAKNGLGRLVLSNPNSTYTGPIAINGGILEIGGGEFTLSRGTASSGPVTQNFNVGTAGRLGNGNHAGAMSIASGATFFYNSTSDTTLNGVVSGDGAIQKDRSGTLILAGANSYTGGTVVSGGILSALSTASLPGFDVPDNVVFSGGTIGVTMGGGGWTATDVDTLLANATKTSGALGIDTGNGDLSQWAAFTTTNLGPSLGLTKFGANNLTMNLANTYTGATTVSGGSLTLSAPATLGSGANALIMNGGTMDLGALSLPVGAVTISAAGASGETIHNGSLTATSYEASNSTGNAVISANLLGSGAAGFVKTGAGAVTLGGVNTYTGATEIDAGALVFQTTGSATSDVLVAEGATVGASLAANNGQWVTTGGLTLADNSTLLVDLAAATPSSSVAPMQVGDFVAGIGETVQITSGNLFAGLEVGQGYPLVTWSGSGPVDASAFSSLVLAHRVEGNLSVTGGDTLTLNMTYNAPGPLNWNTGDGNWDTITSNWIDSGGDAATFIDTLDSVTFGDAPGVTGNPSVVLGTFLSPVTVTMNSAVHDYSVNGTGAISGAASLILDAANTRTLSIATYLNDYSGDTSILGGTLKITDYDVIPHGSGKGNVAVEGGGVFDLNGQISEIINGLSGNGTVDTLAAGTTTFTVGTNNVTSEFSGVIQNTLGEVLLTKAGSGRLTLSGANTHSGGTTISAGVLQVGSGGSSGSLGSGIVTISAGNLEFDRSDSFDFTNEITGGGSVRQIGTGTTELSFANTYTGATIVSAGRLDLTNRGEANMGAVTVSGDASAVLGFSGSATFNLASSNMFVGTGAGGAGTVDQTGGTVTSTGGNGLLIGNGDGGAVGIYNLSAGTLSTYASASRGVMLGVNTGNSGIFNLSGSGDLQAGHLAVGRNDAVSTDCTVAFNQTGGIANVTNLSVGGYSGAVNTNATFSLTGGVFAATNFQNLVAAASSSAQITLGGSAEVTLPAFPVPAGTANITFDFTTGFISPTVASASYLNGMTGVFLTTNGANFNVPDGRNITVSQSFQDAPSQQGALRKTGDGVLLLAGSSTYTGGTLVSGGSLKFSTSATSTTDVTAASGGFAGVQLAETDGQWENTASLTVENGGSLDIDYGGVLPSTTTAPIKVDDFTVAAGAAIRIAGIGFVPGQSYPLVTWTGSGPVDGSGFTLSDYPNLQGNLSVVGNTLFLNVTELVFISWNTGDGDWDTITPNWVDSSLSPATYADLDSVLFGDASGVTGNPVVNLATPVTPLSVTLNSADHDYTISGTGEIAGGASVVLAPTNTRTHTLATANSFNSGVRINGGTLRVGNNMALGANQNTLTVASGGTLDFNGSQTAARDYDAVIAGSGVGGAGAIINNGADHTNGLRSITLASNAAIGGTGRYDLRPITAGTGFIDLAGFTLTKTGSNSISVVDSVITEDGSIQISEGTLGLTRNTISGAGTITVSNGGTLLFENNTAGSFNKAIFADGGNIRVIGTAVSTAAPVSFANGTSVQTVAELALTGEISGSGTITKSESGVWSLEGANTFSGAVVVSAGGLAIGNPAALSTASELVLGGSTLRVDVPGASINGDITLNGDATVTMTVPGSGTPVVNLGAIGGTGNLTLQNIAGSNPQTTFIMNGESDMTGILTLTATNANSSVFIRLGTNNGLSPNSVLTLNGGNGAGSGRLADLDLNGFDQTLAGLAGPPSPTASRSQRVKNNTETHSTLTINDDTNRTFPGLLGAGGNNLSLTKGGSGTFTVSGARSYSGNTSVTAGKLVLGTLNANDNASAVTIEDTAKLQLSFAGTDVVDKLFLGNIQQEDGFYGHTNSGADNGGLGVGELDAWFDPGAGILEVISGPGTGGYGTWATTNAPTTGNDPNADEDGDGVTNGAEYVLGGTIATNDADKLPAVSVDGADLVFTFKRDQGSIDGTTDVSIDVGTNLADWPVNHPVPEVETVVGTVTVAKNTEPGMDTVTLTVTRAPDAAKFARLKVIIEP